MAAFKLLGIKASRRHVEQMVAQADPDGSGEIEIDEFSSIMGGSLNSRQQAGGAEDVSPMSCALAPALFCWPELMH